jgi:peptidoglycan/xylan/chitin deacetylase (PgdA/CDA1 family)
MIDDSPLTGFNLPAKTLCFTFDDGPGEDTVELGRFLQQENIVATFFIVGAHAKSRMPVLEDLAAQGHLLANHTFSHPGLVDLVNRGGDPADELLQTEYIINAVCNSGVKCFRPPYGSWRAPDNKPSNANPYLAGLLNANPCLAEYVGPILWDISADDFAFWERGEAAADCCDAYLNAIEQVQRGIVLMHDSSENPAARRNNRTLEVNRQLVPILKARGFRFVPMTYVPDVKCRLKIASASI